nr:immunoglobulin heavy chain junction region [Macaca mulatta]MOX59643.1 immunoglobulin heavy chain junction region [Macaca mulatta]MOX60492.1 immunoglobulin heavy chain junction region [Macaca mulatta]MOX61306.1 immunoglobulin heavy chain junction region [Macaca mulatta]MOX62155.1 immunoglobulin heavy chain junction region [Macaca mulatta]
CVKGETAAAYYGLDSW